MTDAHGDVVTSEALSRFLDTKWLGRPSFCYRHVSSTMDAARRSAESTTQHGAIVVADSQSRGRGTRGREWSSLPGLGIWCSALLPAEVAAGPTALTVASAIVAAVKSCGVEDAGVKWPNDVVTGSGEGVRKLAGILVEPVPGDPVRFNTGIGINVHHRAEDFPSEIGRLATSVRIAGGRRTQRAELLGRVLREIELRIDAIIGGHTPDLESIVAEWNAVSATCGRDVRLSSDGTTARALAIQADGALIVDRGGTLTPIYSGSADLLDHSGSGGVT